MRIVTVRRISQAFFLILFLWLCVASSFGTQWWQLRGWPVNWLLQLDPLVALGVVLTTGTLYAGLLWALATVLLTILLGRFFCGWLCPLGTLQHLAGYVGRRGRSVSLKIGDNAYHPAQKIKYWLLLLLLSAAAGAMLARGARALWQAPSLFWTAVAVTGALLLFSLKRFPKRHRRVTGAFLLLAGIWAATAFLYSVESLVAASLQTGLLDPIPLVTRSVNLVLLPLADASTQTLSPVQRYYQGGWLIGAVFLAILLLSLRIPRFYCRFLCPLGALFGVLGRYALWRVGTTCDECVRCGLCEAHCEGACEPSREIRSSECVLCMNCLHECRHNVVTYAPRPSAAGEKPLPDLSRRGFVAVAVSGVVLAPAFRLSGFTASAWNSGVIRPPGALDEGDFLARCIKCGQCMRVCPTNIVHPAGLESGVEGLWTPVLHFRIGTSGCQLNCTACSHVCPTAALRPITLDEKLGLGDHASAGPIRLGTAFVDRGRCLPWAMDRPCIVCEENCPVSPKAIFVEEHFRTVRGGVLEVGRADSLTVEPAPWPPDPGRFANGDYFLVLPGIDEAPRRIAGHDGTRFSIAKDRPWTAPPPLGSRLEIQVRLQLPRVDPERCIGCGTCEHECPVSGKRAIRITAENESRNRKHSLLASSRIKR